MSFGFSIGDLVSLLGLAWRVYKSCKDSFDEFKNISSEVAGLHIVLLETKDFVTEHGEILDASREDRLAHLAKSCSNVLIDREAMLSRYKSLGSKTQRTWDRLRWGKEDITQL
jgi:hypothetical protein